jgi:hypothetical protein
MVDDTPEDISPLPDSGRAKRAPPTIDLEASEVKQETSSDGAEHRPEPSPAGSRSATAAWIVAMASGASTAALVIAVAWYLGSSASSPPPSAPQVNTADIDALAARIASVESKSDKPAATAPDPALAARIDTLEKSLSSLKSDVAGAKAQSDKLAADINTIKSEPVATSPPPDLSAIKERLDQLERAVRAESAQVQPKTATPADDVPLRRAVAAALLDVHVRTGDPYPAALTAAKSLAPNPDALKPLDTFAAAGVPNPAGLSRELLTLVPKLQPPAADNATTGSGLVERLQAGASKLVRIERTDATGDGRGAVVGRVTAAALRNDLTEARRELNTLSPADRAAAQAWLDKADARDAALAASRQFATEAMTALAKPTP